ncbi:MAG TPA: peptide chain release factor N(5)-glutamine methyltransferase [Bdellovibrio sp.]|nr:peptide chain release factor N(5)-glutamine methyltransferase [Bdellovibrio sp.]
MKLKEVLDKTTAFFKEKKIETPRLDAELLFAHALKLERIQLYLKFDQPLQESELETLRGFVRRRAQGEPVAYILGYRDFFGYRFEVDASTLVPRPETEILVEEVLKWASNKEEAFNIVDLGTGTGCIGLSLLKNLPHAQLLAVDSSEKALEVAQRNAVTLEVSERAHFLLADAGNVDLVMSKLKEFMKSDKLDVLVSNPPYIAKDDLNVEENVKKFEPTTALFADDEGLALLKKWSTSYSRHLAQKSLMLMEMGWTQGPAMKNHFDRLEIFNEVRIVKDLSGHDRVIYGVRNG